MTVHIIGTGISGLSAAYKLTQNGIPVVLYDAAARAGGRCHSFFDKKLNALIDNGTHLMLGANTALLEMLSNCPTKTPLKNIGGRFVFYRKNETSFQIDTGKPLSILKHLKALYPLLCESVMNTPVKNADTAMLFKTALKCFGKKNGLIYLAYPSLNDSVISPVVDFLKSKNVPFHFGKRLNKIGTDDLIFSDGTNVSLTEKDRVILAVSPNAASALSDKIQAMPVQPIANIHYKTDTLLPDALPLIGLIGLKGHWVFTKNGVLSVTISAAEELLRRQTPDELAVSVWQELKNILKTTEDCPPYRVVIERRATLFQSKEINKRRPFADAASPIILAGDFTATDLPCTIEGAVRSGFKAAENILKQVTES